MSTNDFDALNTWHFAVPTVQYETHVEQVWPIIETMRMEPSALPFIIKSHTQIGAHTCKDKWKILR